MSEGHKHWTVKVRRDSRIHRALTWPILFTRNEAWVDRSRFIFGPVAEQGQTIEGYYMLRPLGILHGLFGLTLEVRDGVE